MGIKPTVISPLYNGLSCYHSSKEYTKYTKFDMTWFIAAVNTMFKQRLIDTEKVW